MGGKVGGHVGVSCEGLGGAVICGMWGLSMEGCPWGSGGETALVV